MAVKMKWYTNKNKDYYLSVKDINNTSIKELNPFFLRTYELTSKVEDIIKESLFMVLDKINLLHLKDTIYTVVKEILSVAAEPFILSLLCIY